MNKAEPCVLANTPVSIDIGLISVVDLPSDLILSDKICSRKADLSLSSTYPFISFLSQDDYQ